MLLKCNYTWLIRIYLECDKHETFYTEKSKFSGKFQAFQSFVLLIVSTFTLFLPISAVKTHVGEPFASFHRTIKIFFHFVIAVWLKRVRSFFCPPTAAGLFPLSSPFTSAHIKNCGRFFDGKKHNASFHRFRFNNKKRQPNAPPVPLPFR